MQAKARETAARVAVEATGVGLSREARTRLSWMDFYRETKNAALTCRRFGIARQTFYGWQRRDDPMDLTSLESGSHRPRRCRPADVVFSLRKQLFEVAVAAGAEQERTVYGHCDRSPAGAGGRAVQ